MRQFILVIGLTIFFEAIAMAAGFTDNGNGTVTDTTTSLMWQQCSAGLSTTTTSCDTGTATTFSSWNAAVSYCQDLSLAGFTDLRLPNVKELKSISDTGYYSPAIDTTYFPNTKTSSYWSSTNCVGGSCVWVVGFNDGGVGISFMSTSGNGEGYVRCVRYAQ